MEDTYNEYEKRTLSLMEPIVEKVGVELVDVEWVREDGSYFLRAYIDKPGGVSLGDCEAVSAEMNPVLDREDYIREAYTFEVSSPGLTRPLKRERDYERNVGRPVEIRLYSPLRGQKAYEGTLLSWDDTSVTIGPGGGGDLRIPKKQISMIRQAFTD